MSYRLLPEATSTQMKRTQMKTLNQWPQRFQCFSDSIFVNEESEVTATATSSRSSGSDN